MQMLQCDTFHRRRWDTAAARQRYFQSAQVMGLQWWPLLNSTIGFLNVFEKEKSVSRQARS